MFRHRYRQMLTFPAVAVWCCGTLLAAEVELPSSLKACAALKRNSERLGCYDRAIEQLSADTPDQTVAAEVSAESMFGMNAETTPAGRSAITRTEIAEIRSPVRTIRMPGGATVIELENGQVWRQERSTNLSLKVGDAVTISRAALGAFKLSAPNGRFVRVSRIK